MPPTPPTTAQIYFRRGITQHTSTKSGAKHIPTTSELPYTASHFQKRHGPKGCKDATSNSQLASCWPVPFVHVCKQHYLLSRRLYLEEEEGARIVVKEDSKLATFYVGKRTLGLGSRHIWNLKPGGGGRRRVESPPDSDLGDMLMPPRHSMAIPFPDCMYESTKP